MKSIITVTIFVEPNSLTILLKVLEVLDNLSLQDYDCYAFTPSDIIFSEGMISNYIWLNVPVELYKKFKTSYLKQKK